MDVKSLAEFPSLYLQFANDTAFVQPLGYRTARWSYRQVAELAFRFARELESRGIGKGDAVVLWGSDSAEWAAAFFGCMLRGAVAVPMDRIAAPDFMQRVAADVQAKLVVAARELLASAQPRLGEWPTLPLEDLPEIVSHFPALEYPAETLARDDTAEIVFTSGTTAEPRGVVLTHGNLLASLRPIADEIPKY